MKIGLISDTHGYMDPVVPAQLAGVEHILHAGDIGLSSLILNLEMVAPVTAVLGNVDAGLPYRETEVVTLGGRKFLLHHIVNVQSPALGLRRRLEREQPDVVVFGHTHRPHCELVQGRLFVNPGSAGKARFHLPRSIAILHLDGSEIRPEFIELGR